MIVVKILEEICKQNGIGNNNHKGNKDMETLRLIHARVRRKFFGQFLEKEQTERVLQVLGPMPLDIKHAVFNNPCNPTGLCPYSTYKTALPSNAWLSKKWKFHHHAHS